MCLDTKRYVCQFNQLFQFSTCSRKEVKGSQIGHKSVYGTLLHVRLNHLYIGNSNEPFLLFKHSAGSYRGACSAFVLIESNTKRLDTSIMYVLFANKNGGGGPGSTTTRKIGWSVRHASQILILFMTKICNFPYPIYDLTKNSIPYL